MLSDEEFTTVLDRARSGDPEAARTLVEMYAPEIRRAARVRLKDSKLRRLVDSIDISQSVFGKFFDKSQSEEGVGVDTPEQMLGLLVTMTKNRVIDEHRRQTAQKRNAGEGVVEAVSDLVVAEEPGPRTAMEMSDLMAKVRSHMSAEEQAVSDLRSDGLSWEEVAKQLGGTADSHRKRLDRAFQRIRSEMKNPNDSTG